MKRFTVPCDFEGTKHPFHVYIGQPHKNHHPLKYQSAWLNEVRGGTVPKEVMGSFERLKNIADENNVSFEDLCVYAMGTATSESDGSNK